MAKFNKSFKKNPKYVHQRSEGLTRRGQERQERLMLGPQRKKNGHNSTSDSLSNL